MWSSISVFTNPSETGTQIKISQHVKFFFSFYDIFFCSCCCSSSSLYLYSFPFSLLFCCTIRDLASVCYRDSIGPYSDKWRNSLRRGITGSQSKVAIKWMKLLLCDRKIPGSNIGPDIAYPEVLSDFPRSVQSLWYSLTISQATQPQLFKRAASLPWTIIWQHRKVSCGTG
jgi:hypothetical protein